MLNSRLRGKVVASSSVGGNELSDLPEETVSSALAMGALELVLASTEFVSSPQLSRLLRYLVENAVAGNQPAVRESAIASAVFRRGNDFDPKLDPIVRVEARRLRSRLDDFYSTPACSVAEVRIRIPKGAYQPMFERIAPGLAGADRISELKVESDLNPAAAPTSLQGRSRGLWVALSVFVILAALGTYIASGNIPTQKPDQMVREFWASILGQASPALVVAADSGLVMLEDTSDQEPRLTDYASGGFVGQMAAGSVGGSDPRFSFGKRRYTSFADLDFTLRLASRTEGKKRIDVRFARDLRAHDLADRNLILLGSRRSNPWVELFEGQAAFRLSQDTGTGLYRISNFSPAVGEPREITVTPTQALTEVHGILSFHRNPNSNGWVLLVRGTTFAGTEAAMNLVLDDRRLGTLLGRAVGAKGLQGFDILVVDRNVAGSASHANVVSMKIDGAQRPARP